MEKRYVYMVEWYYNGPKLWLPLFPARVYTLKPSAQRVARQVNLNSRGLLETRVKPVELIGRVD